MFSATVEKAYAFQLFDDFLTLNSTLWPSTDDGGAVSDAVADSPGGVLQLLPTAALNKYRARATANKLFYAAKGKSLLFECKLNLTEANVNKSMIFAGLTNLVTTGFLADTTGVPLANFSGFVFYKLPSSSVWNFIASNGTTQATTLNVGAFTSGADQTLEFLVDANDGVNIRVTPILNGVYPISQAQAQLVVPLAALAGLRPAFGVKNGSASAETLNVDYIAAEQTR